jgi:zinc transporter 2
LESGNKTHKHDVGGASG